MFATAHCAQTDLPVFKLKDSKVRRRYSDFVWLKEELERESKVSLCDCFSIYSKLNPMPRTPAGHCAHTAHCGAVPPATLQIRGGWYVEW